MNERDPLDIRDLALFVGEDEDAATLAFGRLSERIRPLLQAFLIQSGVKNAQDIEEVIQNSLLKIWLSRGAFANLGVRAWKSYTTKTTFRCMIDFRRANKDNDQISANDEEMYRFGTVLPTLSAEEIADIEEIVVNSIEIEWLYHMADALWLGLDPARPAAFHNRQLLAALLFYIDGADWRTILRRLNAHTSPEAPITREALDTWLTDPGVLRHLAFQQIYYSNARLAGHLLGLPSPVEPGHLEALLTHSETVPSSEPALHNWTWGEVRIILWRFYRALLIADILKLPKISYSSEELRLFLDRCALSFPFQSTMERLIEGLECAPEALSRAKLGERALWKRLTLEYRFRDQLSHEDILQRTKQAAMVVNSDLNPGILNSWLSNGRLYKELADFCRATPRS